MPPSQPSRGPLEEIEHCEHSYTDTDARSAQAHRYRGASRHEPPTQERPSVSECLSSVMLCVAQGPRMWGSAVFWSPENPSPPRPRASPPRMRRLQHRCFVNKLLRTEIASSLSRQTMEWRVLRMAKNVSLVSSNRRTLCESSAAALCQAPVAERPVALPPARRWICKCGSRYSP